MKVSGAATNVAGIGWIAEQVGLSTRHCRRLATQRLIPGLYRSQRGGRWKVNKVKFLEWLDRITTT
jgi:hypothetical protein